MQPVINQLPLRPAKTDRRPAETFPDETSGYANLTAWQRPISRPVACPVGCLAVIGHVLAGALFTLGLLLFIR